MTTVPLSKSKNQNNEAFGLFLQEVASNPSLLTSEEAHISIARQVHRTLNVFLLRRSDDDLELDVTDEHEQFRKPLSALGLDSFVAVELRNWFRQTLSMEVSVMQVMEAGNLVVLAKEVAGRMREKYVAADAAGSSVPNGVNGNAEEAKTVRGEEWPLERQTKIP